MLLKSTLLAVLFLTFSSVALAVPRESDGQRSHPPAAYGSHAGRTDTDGILSPGERPNPNIDYDQVQREGEREDDARVDNLYNDSAAEADREAKEEQRGRYAWDSDTRDYDRRYPEQHSDSWWKLW